MENKKLTLSAREVCDLLGISEPIFYKLAKRPDFPALRIGKKILVNKSKLQEWLDRESEKPIKEEETEND